MPINESIGNRARFMAHGSKLKAQGEGGGEPGLQGRARRQEEKEKKEKRGGKVKRYNPAKGAKRHPRINQLGT